ncbi:MAG: GNAT family N-acetyltransferase [Ilumatobacter sp.]
MRQATATPTARAALRRWPYEPAIAHLVLLDIEMVPNDDDVQQWITDASASPSPDVDRERDGQQLPPATRIRTGALFPRAAAAFIRCGFVEVDRLALLERSLHDVTPTSGSSTLTTARLRRRDIESAAAIDHAAFPSGWRHDTASLDDIATATPQARLRLAVTPDQRRSRQQPVGFAITGRSGPNGYLQRIGVRPDAQRNGAGRLLVDDALNWLVRRGAQRALVNTGTDNHAALTLYRRAGFEPMPDELVVLERAA